MANLVDSQVREIDELTTDWMLRNPIPGASVVLVDEEGELYAEGFGTSDLETNEPVTPDTLFGMGSISKSVTALAVLQLSEAGTLSVDDEVDAYVEDLADLPGNPVTIEELLSHTSGIPSTDMGAVTQTLMGTPGGVADGTDRRRLFRAKADLRVTEDERFFYNNAGYGVLGAVVEAVDGRSYESYVREEILAPLGMDRAGIGEEALDDDDAMTPYLPGEDAPEEAPSPYDELMHAPGGLVASTREIGRYLRAMMTDGAIDGGRVCEPDTVERLQRPRVAPRERLDGAESSYGYGWSQHPFDDDELVGHDGSVIVSSAYAGFLVNEGIGVVVACNTMANTRPARLAKTILAAATGRDRTVVPAYALEKKAEAVTGTYTNYRESLEATVGREGGGLEMRLKGPFDESDRVVTLFPETLDPGDYRFYTVTDGGWRSEVEFDVDGDQADLFYGRDRLRRKEPGT